MFPNRTICNCQTESHTVLYSTIHTVTVGYILNIYYDMAALRNALLGADSAAHTAQFTEPLRW